MKPTYPKVLLTLIFLTLIWAVTSTLIGCTGSLESRYEDSPSGTFGPQAVQTARSGQAGAPPAGLQEPDPQAIPGTDDADANEPSDSSAESDAGSKDGVRSPILTGPPSSEELTDLGLPVEEDALTTFQSEDWVPGDALDFETGRQAFLARSSSVASAVQRYRASLTRYDQVDYLNDLVRQYDSFAENLMTSASTPHVMPPRPSWPLGNTGALQGELADIEVAISMARLERKVLLELADFEKTYHNAIYWARAAKTYGATRRLARDVRNVARSLYKTGRGGYLPVLLADNRIDVLAAREESAEEQAQAEREKLSALLELPTGSLEETEIKLGVPDPSLPERDELAEMVLQNSPDIAEATAVTQRSQLMVELVESQLLPELSPGTSYTRTGEIPDRSKADLMYATRAPFLAELRLVEESAEAALDHTQRMAPARADERWAQLSSALRSLKLADGPLQRRTREAREVAEDGFRTGEVSFVTLNEALTTVLETDLDVHRYRRDAAVANAMLRVTTGTSGGAQTPPGSKPGAGDEPPKKEKQPKSEEAEGDDR